jgi:hypothetical protein
MNKIIVSLSTIATLLLVANIVYSCLLVTDGKMMKTTENEIEHLRDQELSLSHEIASASSLLVISEKAKNLGFSAPATVVTMRPDQFVVALGISR